VFEEFNKAIVPDSVLELAASMVSEYPFGPAVGSPVDEL
jgi:hypothetical protein